MAFPASPSDKDLYTTSLGTQYQYDSTRTAWMLTTAGSLGTNNHLAMFSGGNLVDSFVSQGTYTASNTLIIDVDDVAYAGIDIKTPTESFIIERDLPSEPTDEWLLQASDNLRVQTNNLRVSPLNDYATNVFSVDTTAAKVSVDGTVIINSDLTGGYEKSLFSVNQMTLSELEGGAYFGRVGITENLWDVTNFGQKWKVIDAFVTSNIAMSSSGKHISTITYGGYIQTSDDYGVTWTQHGDSTKLWVAVAMSSDGKIQTATGTGYIYRSTNYGATWSPSTNDGTHSWGAVAMSADGKIQTIVFGDDYSLYRSNDYGATWALISGTTGAGMWISLAMSSDGKIQTAGTFIGDIWSSYDYGATWIDRASIGAGLYWHTAMSSDGKFQTAMQYTPPPFDGTCGRPYTSSDYGVTWTPRDTTDHGAWQSVALSSSGQIQLGCAQFDVYISTDYGVNWVPTGAGAGSDCATMSSDGRIMAFTSGFMSISYADVDLPGSNLLIKSDATFSGKAIFSDATVNNAVANGTYTVGYKLTGGGTNGTITISGGIITAIQQAT